MNLQHLLIASVEGHPDPAGLVTLYAPVNASFSGNPALKRYPVSSAQLSLPEDGRSVIPRVGLGLMGELVYGPAGLEAFEPRLFCAMDVPLLAATPAAPMLVDRLNWGPGSVGVSDALQFVDHLGDDGVLGRARMAGWIEREGNWLATCEDAPVSSLGALGLAGKRLADYVAFTLKHQVADGPWDALGEIVAAADRPPHVLVCGGVGLPPDRTDPPVARAGDTVHAVVYDAEVIAADEVFARMQAGALRGDGISSLSRTVIGRG